MCVPLISFDLQQSPAACILCYGLLSSESGQLQAKAQIFQPAFASQLTRCCKQDFTKINLPTYFAFLLCSTHTHTHTLTHTHAHVHTTCIHTHVLTHANVHTHKHTQAHRHKHTNTQVDLRSSLAYFMMTHPFPVAGYLPIKTFVARQLPTNVHTCTMSHMHIYTHASVHTHRQIHSHKHKHNHTCTHTHTHTHTHTQQSHDINWGAGDARSSAHANKRR